MAIKPKTRELSPRIKAFIEELKAESKFPDYKPFINKPKTADKPPVIVRGEVPEFQDKYSANIEEITPNIKEQEILENNRDKSATILLDKPADNALDSLLDKEKNQPLIDNPKIPDKPPVIVIGGVPGEQTGVKAKYADNIDEIKTNIKEQENLEYKRAGTNTKLLDKPADKVLDNNLDSEWFTEGNLKETASYLETIATSEGYDYELDKEGVYIDEAGRCHYGVRKIDFNSHWEQEAKKALALLRETIPPEVFLASLKYVSVATKQLISNWGIEGILPVSDNLPDTLPEQDTSISEDSGHVSEKLTDNLPDKVTYKYITDNEDLKKAIASIATAKVLGIDTETTGLDPHLHKLRLIQIATPDNLTLVIDCFKCDALLIQPILLNDAIKVFHNAKFDLQFILKLGLDINQKLFDTQLAYQLLKAGKEGDNKCSLKALTKQFLNIELDKDSQLSDWSADTLSGLKLGKLL